MVPGKGSVVTWEPDFRQVVAVAQLPDSGVAVRERYRSIHGIGTTRSIVRNSFPIGA